MKVVVSYDISDDRRRNKVRMELYNWGVRVQYSVFECNLSPKQVERMERRLKGLIKEEDSLRIYILCNDCINRIKIYGPVPLIIEEEDVIFI
jgi:CRISPR-associated protein Cas2